MDEPAIKLMESIRSEAWELCGYRGDTSPEALRQAERQLNYGRYLQAVRPIMDAKVRLLCMALPRYTMTLGEDGKPGAFHVDMPDLSPKIVEAFDRLDELLVQLAASYGITVQRDRRLHPDGACKDS